MPAIVLSWTQARSLRLHSQRLAAPSDRSSDPAQVVRDVFALQAQDASAANLSVRVRSTGLTVNDVERARLQDRTLVRTWALRGTLHLLATADLVWLLPYLAPRFIQSNQRRRVQLGLDDAVIARALPALRDLLQREGPLTRAELAARLRPLDIPVEGQAIAHLVGLAALEGIMCLGPDRGSKPTYAPLSNWIAGDLPSPSDDVLGWLARRYLHAYGPAGPEDLAAWAGITLSDARAGFAAQSDDLIEVQIEGSQAWILKEQAHALDQPENVSAPVKLLPAFDTVLLGYRSRDWFLPAQFAERVLPGGGMLRPAVLVDGWIVGAWKSKKVKHSLQITVEPFAELTDEARAGVAAEVEDIGRFLELTTTLETIKPIQ
jgi:hypothetical protein